MKRTLEVIAATFLLVATLPLMAVVALVVRLSLGPPVLFRQRRAGLLGRPFVLYKFRTMRDERGPDGEPLADEWRMTRVGRFLRRTSLDELPQLYNVLRGDLSFVGPRPLLPEYLPLYSLEQARRHDVRPGITGLAQVAGRNAVSWPERLRLDVEYVERRSLWLDVRILARTLLLVVTGRGISAPGHATQRKFRGER